MLGTDTDSERVPGRLATTSLAGTGTVRLVSLLDLAPCSVSLAWWPQDTGLVAELAAVANEVRAPIVL